jgi:hypothetical protein
MLILGGLLLVVGGVLDSVFRFRMSRIGQRWALLQGGAFDYSRYHKVREEHGWAAWPGYLMWIASASGIALLMAGFFSYFGASPTRQSAITQLESHDFGSQMVNYTKQGRYEDAIQVGLDALENQPSDEGVYQQIADVYFIRAQKDSDRRQGWVTRGVSYVEKSLSLNSKDRDIAGVQLFQAARSFEFAGDL